MVGKRWIPTYNISPTPSRASRWRSQPSYHRRRPIDYTNLHGGTHVRILITFSKNIFSKIFWALSKGPDAQHPHFPIPFSRYVPSDFSPTLHPDSRFAEAVDTYLQRHPYTITYHVTSASSPASRRVSGLRFLIIFSKTKIFKIFWALSIALRGSRPPFSNSLLALRNLGFFRLSASIYACGEAVEPNLQRHPYAKMVRPVQG